MGLHDRVAEFEDPNRAHALFAPSSAAGWTACPGFLHANYDQPDTAGKDAAYGTVCHALVEESLNRFDGSVTDREGQTLFAMAGGESYGFTVDHDMLSYVEDCLRHVALIPGDKFFETRVLFDDLTPIRFQGGTCDFAACTPGRLVIRDWKFGIGVKVFAERNPQLLLYAYGFFREWDWMYGFDEIEVGIVQPRLEHYDIWVISRADLLAFADWIRERASAAWQVDAPRIAGPKQCQWCKVAVKCAANLAVLESLADGLLDDVSGSETTATTAVATRERLQEDRKFLPPDPKNLTTADLAKILPSRKHMERWFGLVAEELLARALQGETVPGYKVVQGKAGRRQFVSPAAAIEAMTGLGLDEADCYDRSVISVPEAVEKIRDVLPLNAKGRRPSREKVDKMLAEVVVRPPGDVTLVSESDDRQAVPGPDDLLDDVSDGL